MRNRECTQIMLQQAYTATIAITGARIHLKIDTYAKHGLRRLNSIITFQKKVLECSVKKFQNQFLKNIDSKSLLV